MSYVRNNGTWITLDTELGPVVDDIIQINLEQITQNTLITGNSNSIVNLNNEQVVQDG